MYISIIIIIIIIIIYHEIKYPLYCPLGGKEFQDHGEFQEDGTSSKYNPVSKSCAVAKSEKFWQATAQSYLTYQWLSATKASNVWFLYSHNCTFVLSAKFDCPEACQNCSLFATAHDCKTGLLVNLSSGENYGAKHNERDDKWFLKNPK